MRSFIVLPALAALGASQSTTASTDVPADVNPTPDALDLAFLRKAVVPTYTTVEGVSSQDIPYSTATAIAAVEADQAETPLSVFPAVTTVAINAAGEDGAAATASPTAAKRDIDAEMLQKRTACAPQATISNYYNVDVSSYEKFKADTVIASVANAAPTPQGYFQNFKNKDAANSAYAYLGYTVVDTGYDVDSCAKACTNKEGCLAFNIYFERDPVVEPGSTCENPDAFANIKCSFWGSALDAATATNDGQWRAQFRVGIAGSNAYTSYKVGGSIDGWADPLSLDNAALNAPLRDCAGTWTYMGYKLFQNGPFDSSLCAAACDAQTKYNIAHPPSSGYTPLCAAFGTYLLTKTNSTGSYIQGQMCTMYTSAWGKDYAVNTASYDDSIGAKYTYSYSFFYSKTELQPVCDADLSDLKSNGAEFCTSYLSYTPPVTTTTVTRTHSGFVTQFSTSTTSTTTVSTVTVSNTGVWKRDESSSDTSATATATDYTTIANLATDSVAVLAEVAVATPVSNGSFVADSAIEKRAVATPAAVSNWAAYKISAACSRVATGTFTMTATATAPTLTTTVGTLGIATATATCALPTQNSALFGWNPLVGNWDSSLGQPSSNTAGAAYSRAYTVQIPFEICMYGSCTSVLSVGTNGYASFSDVMMSVYSDLGSTLYIYPGGAQGIFYRVSGPVGSRRLTFGWFTGTYSWGHQVTHVSMEFREDESNTVYFKYFDVNQDAPYNNRAKMYVSKNGAKTWAVAEGSKVDAGAQAKISASGSSVSVELTSHDRVDCCTKAGWHMCTEFGADGSIP
ncbi:hypothetical protein B0J12DRAFT_696947 [Macrophomina phaseolina]|uniref:Carbohydrate-binding-like protein n=1 Tax=Macrophomina phaseolina TaxID=35725 RepID=A0ABQ8GIZ3_9PEZI|nr:hypothetical protein B0J12DRAFT_696947 [Macrophomina phaseolina]